MNNNINGRRSTHYLTVDVEESGVGGKILFEAWVFGLSSRKALWFFTGVKPR